MTKHNPKNERMKHRYLAYLEEAKRMSPVSADTAAAAIAQFEAANGWKDFAAFHIEQARRFKRVLDDARHASTGRPLAKATIHSRLLALRAFFAWLAEQPGYKSHISRTDCDYFNPSANDSRIATARRERPVPEIGQIRHLLERMPDGTEIEKRDRALIAFALLSGARDDAIASLNLGHVDPVKRSVFQDARIVRTKNRKTFTSSFFPVGEDIDRIVSDWIAYLRVELHFGKDDPLFPATRVGVGPQGDFAVDGLERRHWRNAASIRRIFHQAFEAAGLPYFHPHSFRHTLARLGEQVCASPEQLKAWSQNLGHESVLTTLTSYGAVSGRRQAQIMDGLRDKAGENAASGDPDAETVERVVSFLNRRVTGR